MDKNVMIYIGIMFLVTTGLKFLPFVIFSGKNTPKYIVFLGEVLPYALISILIVYCLRFLNFLENDRGLPEILAVLFVVVIHIWRKNTLLSVCLGTFFYMLLVQKIFI